MKQPRLHSTVILFIISIGAFAQNNSEEVDRWKKIAMENEVRALKAETLAAQNEQIAKRAMDDAKRIRYLETSFAMARKSEELDDPELRVLIAVQAFEFNKKYFGYKYDRDIYNGLLGAMRANNTLESFSMNAASRLTVANTHTGKIYAITPGNKLIERSAGDLQEKVVTQLDKKLLVSAIELSPNGKRLCVALTKGSSSVFVYDTENIHLPPMTVSNINGKVEKIVFVENTTGFYMLVNGSSIAFYQPGATKNVIELKERILTFDVSADGSKLLALTESGKLNLWNTLDYSIQACASMSDLSRISDVKFLPDNNFVSGYDDGTVKIFDHQANQKPRVIGQRKSKITQIAFDVHNNCLIAASADNSITLWNADNLRELPRTIKINEPISQLWMKESELVVALETSKAKDVMTKITFWPLDAAKMASSLCASTKRSLTMEEWWIYVDQSLPYEQACSNNN